MGWLASKLVHEEYLNYKAAWTIFIFGGGVGGEKNGLKI